MHEEIIKIYKSSLAEHNKKQLKENIPSDWRARTEVMILALHAASPRLHFQSLEYGPQNTARKITVYKI